MTTFWLLLPDLALIALGWVLHRTLLREPTFWSGLEKLTYFILFPALLFVTVSRTPILPAEAIPVLAAALGAVAGAMMLAYAARALLRPDTRQFASGVQCAFRFNSYIFLALSHRMAGDPGLALAALIIGVAVPPINVAAVWPLARTSGEPLMRELIRNPLLVATVAGLIANLAGIRLPGLLATSLDRLGSASLVLGLLSVGAGLKLGQSAAIDPGLRASALRLIAWFSSVKLFAMPLFALALVRVFELDPMPAQIVVVYAALPTAPAAYVLATRMGGDGALVAALISVSLVGSAFTIPFWLAWL
jgi:malonate transporter